MNSIRFAKYARHVKTMSVRKENYRPGSPEEKNSTLFKAEIHHLKQKLALQNGLKSPLRVFSRESPISDVKAIREKDQQQWEIDTRQMQRVLKENEKLKKEIHRLVQKQVQSMRASTHLGKNEEVDSTNSGFDENALLM